MVQEVSLTTGFDFVQWCNTTRIAQVIGTAFQLLLIYSESANLSYVAFLLYISFVAAHCVHVCRRWYYNIDGRYDLRQLLREQQVTTKIQYSLALFSSAILAFIVWRLVELDNPIVHGLFHVASLLNLGAAIGLLSMEGYDVLVKNKEKASAN